jgi:hypothetical protein
MKDIMIPSKRIKKELITLLICFLIGFTANVGAVIYYKTAAIEIITSLPYVLIFTAVIYVIWSLIRSISLLIIKCERKNKVDNK